MLRFSLTSLRNLLQENGTNAITFCQCSTLVRSTNHVLQRYSPFQDRFTLILIRSKANAPQFHLKSFSTSSPATTTSSSSSSASSSSYTQIKWRWIARTIKNLRIPFLILSVYGFGYQQGIIDYSRDSQKKEDELLQTVLSGVGASSMKRDVQTAKDGDVLFLESNPQLRKLVHVGSRILNVAKTTVQDELDEMIRQCLSTLSDEDKKDQEVILSYLSADETVTYWNDAQRRLEGPWRYILINSTIPNAFVSEVLPKRIFITTAMMDQFIENDDELALVLGHEVAHLILGHVTQNNTFETMLRTIEVLLLSLDPTEGILSLTFMSLLGFTRKILSAAHSRDNERQADELGIKLAAMACYDTEKASKVFYKMHLNDTESGSNAVSASHVSFLSFLDTHPATLERFEFLKDASENENVEKYEDSTCASVQRTFLDLLKLSRDEKKKKQRRKKNEKEEG